ncbi:ATP-binding protein [Magnetospirillum sp. UT-4]|uniref:ATP-binding protein n=1 Tax=Magnetospirillum sp. UT-4 TaxID=2681467 RepID=UPI0013831EB4|nr:ATP-binding protein [Magnetospirillum sp. UT-4]CAA7626984.1 Signal transduction histidine kinase [Magnetospirillum sp. UT-4]
MRGANHRVLAVFAAALLAFAAMLAAADRSEVDAGRHAEVVATFLAVEQAETSMDRDLLQAMVGLLPHFDTVVEHDRALLAHLGRLQADRSLVAAIADALGEYGRRIENKRMAAEDAKALTSFTLKEQAYVPFAVAALEGRVPPERLALLQSAIIRLLGGETERGGAAAAIAPLLDALSRSADPTEAHVAQHARSLLHAREALRDTIEAYLGIDTRSALAAARDRYMEVFAQRQRQMTWLIRALQGATMALFAALGWAISRLDRAHRQAATAHSRLVAAVGSLGDAFALFDNSGRRVVSNAGFTALLDGAAVDGLVALPAGLAAAGIRVESGDGPPASPAAASGLLYQAGGERWHLFRARPTEDGGMVCLFTDVTDLHRADSELRKLWAAVEQSPLAIVITDCRGLIEYVNPRFEGLTGYSAAEAVGNTPRILKSGEVPEATYHEMWTTIAAGLTWRGEMVNRKKTGELFRENTIISPVRDPAGQITHFIALKEDITQQRRNADLLLEASTDYERLLYAASHDLQEPARTVVTYCQRLERQLPAAGDAELRVTLDEIAASARQLSLLIAGLVAYGRTSRQTEAFVPVDCAAAARAAIAELHRADVEVPGIRIGPLPTILGDPVLMIMLLRNLLDNSVKFARPDAPARVELSAAPDGGGWRLDVADNGIGIEAEYLDRVLAPFSRLHPRATYPGAGLGLASCAKIARLHGGRLWLDSTPGQGTTVHVWLPAVAALE